MFRSLLHFRLRPGVDFPGASRSCTGPPGCGPRWWCGGRGIRGRVRPGCRPGRRSPRWHDPVRLGMLTTWAVLLWLAMFLAAVVKLVATYSRSFQPHPIVTSLDESNALGFRAHRSLHRVPQVYEGEVVEARRRRARRPRSLRSTRPASAAAARRAARSSASSSSGPAVADSWPMSRRMMTSVREAISGSATPSIQTRVRRPSPRSSPVIRSSAKMRSARANLPKPKATMRESDATVPS